MTVYKALKLEAETAAQVAIDMVNGKESRGDSADTDGVPTALLSPSSVTKENIMDTVVKDGFYTVADICTRNTPPRATRPASSSATADREAIRFPIGCTSSVPAQLRKRQR